jgi:uncharacterized protein YidB (DUF937 family)
MDELSNLSKSLGSAGAADVGATMGDLAGAIDETGGVDGLVDKLRAGGLDQEVDSWVSTGTNQPVDPQRLGAALGRRRPSASRTARASTSTRCCRSSRRSSRSSSTC